MTESATNRKTYILRELPGQTISLDLRLESGEAWALPYAYLIWMRFDPTGVITIRFSSHTVTIKGRNLMPIHEALVIQRVERLMAESSRYDVGDEKEPFISAILVSEPKEKKAAPE